MVISLGLDGSILETVDILEDILTVVLDGDSGHGTVLIQLGHGTVDGVHQLLLILAVQHPGAKAGIRELYEEGLVVDIDLILDSRRYDFVGALQYGGSFVFTQDKTYRKLLEAKNKDITSFYESNKSAADKYIEDLVKQLEEIE